MCQNFFGEKTDFPKINKQIPALGFLQIELFGE